MRKCKWMINLLRFVPMRSAVRSFMQKCITLSIVQPSVARLLQIEIYYEKKANKNKKRICKTKTCTATLSIYNKENICEQCKRKRFVNRLVSWGWSEENARRGMD